MKKIYTAANLQETSILKDLLQMEGIPSEIRGIQLSNLRGSITEFNPSLWVKESDYERALEKLKEFTSKKTKEEPWICGKCKEENEGQFTNCWNCGYEKPL